MSFGAALEAPWEFLEPGGRWLAIQGASALTRFKPPEVELWGMSLSGLRGTPDLAPEYKALLGVRFVSRLAQQPLPVAPGPHPHLLTEGLAPFEAMYLAPRSRQR